MLPLWLTLAACAAPPAPAAAPGLDVSGLEGARLHLTLDDAPLQLRTADAPVPLDADAVRALNAAVLGHLAAHGAAASVFFNCDTLREGDGTVEAWAAAGHVVGNHTASHARLDAVGLDAWLVDVDRCHEVLTARLGAPPTRFRYPYLNHGTGDLRDAATAALATRGYENVPVTVATSEWVLAFAWLDAADEAARREVIDAYVTHMVEAVGQARALAARTGAGDPVQTVLVHVNPLNAEALDDVLAALRAGGARLVALPEAMADPVFQRPRTYAGPAGLSWLARTAPDGAIRPYWFGEEEGRLQRRFLPED